MNKLVASIGFFMAGAMSFFSPVAMSHGDSGCCAECTFKKEEEVEVVDQKEDNKSKIK